MNTASAFRIACPWVASTDDVITAVWPMSRNVFRIRLAAERDVVLKTSTSHRHEALCDEARVMEVVHDGRPPGIAVPQPMTAGWSSAEGCGYLITSFLRATTLDEWAQANNICRQEVMQLLGKTLARLHRTRGVTYGWVSSPRLAAENNLALEMFNLQREMLQRYDPTLLDAARAWWTRSEPLLESDRTPVLCHGDVHPCNVLSLEEGTPRVAVGLIDYESTSWGFVELDIAKTLVVSDALDNRSRDAVIVGYADGGGRTEDLRAELIEAMALFHAIDGWIHAVTLEGRDRRLWRGRLESLLSRRQ